METLDVWRDLKIPEGAITIIPRGRNTAEEILEFAALVETSGWRDVGVCTSAWHMSRAERLWLAAEQEFTAVPADFRASAFSWSLPDIVPHEDGFRNVKLALKERFARVVGR
jgi:uncharacterized SAM-binding protein YcdF (DUF218 family)